jgi:20S proteasome alpha/beta subunit
MKMKASLQITQRAVTAGLLVLLLSSQPCYCSDRESRYSFSLTTFDPSGRLGQVDRAMQAASLGTPVVAFVRDNRHIVMVSPQVLPSPLILDDGTARFAKVTNEIMIAHSGLSSDGRVIVAAAQRMAVEHEFTFEESMPIDMFLEELSLLYQEYTMKAAARPFGVTLLVGYLPANDDAAADPQPAALYRLDPSGSVRQVKDFAMLNGNLERTQLKALLDDLTKTMDECSMEQDQQALVQAIQQALTEQARKKGKAENTIETILSASLTKEKGQFRVDRHEWSDV